MEVRPAALSPLTLSLTSNPDELWSRPIHMQKIKGKGQVVQKIAKTNGRRDIALPFSVTLSVKIWTLE